MLQKVMSQFCVEKFLSESAETFRRLNLSSFSSFRYPKIFMLQRVMSRYSVETSLSYSKKPFGEETF